MGDQKLTIKFLGDAKSVVDAAKKTSKAVKETAKDTEAAGKFGGVAGAAIAGAFAVAGLAVFKFGKDSVEAYMKSEIAQKRLEGVVNATGDSYTALKPKIDEVLTAQTRLSSVSKGQLRGALSRLTLSIGDTNTALGLMTVTQDLAIAGQMDSEASAKLVSKAWMGNATALKKIGIELPKGAKGMEAIDALQQRVQGSAAEYGETTEASVARANNAWMAFKVNFGAKIAPFVRRYADMASEGMTGGWDAMKKSQLKSDADRIISSRKLTSVKQAENDWMVKTYSNELREEIAKQLVVKATDNKTKAIRDLIKAQAAERDAMTEARDDEMSEAQASIDYQRAKYRLADATKASAEAIKKHGKNSREAKDAALDAKQAELDFAKAAVSAGKTINGTSLYALISQLQQVRDKAAAATAKIRDMTAAQAANSELVQGYRAGDPKKKRARGGINPGIQEEIIWGEDGAEAIIPLSRKYRSEANALMPQVVSALGGGSSTVGDTYIISGYETPEQIEQMFRRFSFESAAAID